MNRFTTMPMDTLLKRIHDKRVLIPEGGYPEFFYEGLLKGFIHGLKNKLPNPHIVCGANGKVLLGEGALVMVLMLAGDFVQIEDESGVAEEIVIENNKIISGVKHVPNVYDIKISIDVMSDYFMDLTFLHEDVKTEYLNYLMRG